MVKKMVIPTPKPEPEPTPAPARITVGEKILARIDEVVNEANAVRERMKDLESQITILSQSIIEVIEQLDEIGPRMERLEVVAVSTRDSAEAAELAVRSYASAAEDAAEEARKEVEKLTERMPDVEEVVQHIRSKERIEWLASLKPAF